MKFVRRLLMALLGLAVVSGIVYAFLPQPVPVDAAIIGRGPLAVTVNEDGKTRIRERYVVSTPLAGQLRRIELDPGDEVVAGETVLATIFPDAPQLLDPRERAESAARVSAAEASVNRAQTSIEAAKVAEEIAEAQHERIRRLKERNAATEQRMEEASLTMRARQEEHRAAEFSLQIAQFELAQAQAALQRFEPVGDNESAEAGDAWHFEIRSPISGRVLRVLQESAAVLPAGANLLELGDPENLELEVDVLSTDAVKIEPGDKIMLEHWGGDESLTGLVRLVEPAAFTKISALGVEEQRVFVIGDLTVSEAQRSRLGDAFRFEARIVVWEEEDVLQCPTAALFRHEDQWAVFVLEEDRAVRKTVSIGQRNADAAQVLEGLSEGERVIVYPSDRVKEGIGVEVRNGK